MPTASMTFAVKVTCAGCGKTLHESTSTTEEEFKAASAKAITASELHDCKGSPK